MCQAHSTCHSTLGQQLHLPWLHLLLPLLLLLLLWTVDDTNSPNLAAACHQ
jgi:hypothetical protein